MMGGFVVVAQVRDMLSGVPQLISGIRRPQWERQEYLDQPGVAHFDLIDMVGE